MNQTSPNTSIKTKFLNSLNVTYQRLAGRWYAFSEVKGEVYFGEVPEKVISTSKGKKTRN